MVLCEGSPKKRPVFTERNLVDGFSIQKGTALLQFTHFDKLFL